MKNILSRKGWCLFALIMLLASCGSTKPVVMSNETIKIKTVTETVHDTIFKIEADSSSYKALLDCQNGKVVVKEVIQSEPGRNLKSPKVRLNNNQLYVDCEARAKELFAQWKSTQETNQEYIEKEVPVVTNELTWWQETQINLFRILAMIILLFFGWKFIKTKFF